MRRRDNLWLLAAVMLLIGAGAQHHRLRAARGGAAATDPGLDQAPPAVVFTTVALSGFRGLLADLLWLRVTHLQDRGEYVELVQLADWVTRLQPRNTEVWNFHAWNMAYNVSAIMPRPSDRWRWVMNGVELLRDRARFAHPGEPLILWNLGWIFSHKIGGASDEAHRFYRREWAARVATALPDGRAADASPDAAAQLGLELDMLHAVEAAHGVMDWCLPEAHALYWACAGLSVAGPTRRAPECERLRYQALADLFKRGRLIRRAADDLYAALPEPARFMAAVRAYDAARGAIPDDLLDAALANFLRDAAALLLAYDRADDARLALERLAQLRPSAAVFTGTTEARVFALLRDGLRDLSGNAVASRVADRLALAALAQLAGESGDARALRRLARLYWRAGAAANPGVPRPSATAVEQLALDLARLDAGTNAAWDTLTPGTLALTSDPEEPSDD